MGYEAKYIDCKKIFEPEQLFPIVIQISFNIPVINNHELTVTATLRRRRGHAGPSRRNLASDSPLVQRPVTAHSGSRLTGQCAFGG